MDYKQLAGEATALLDQAEAILTKEGHTAEEAESAIKMVADAKNMRGKATALKEIKETGAALALETKEKPGDSPPRSEFKSLGEFLVSVAQAGNTKYRGQLDPRLKDLNDPEDKSAPVSWAAGDSKASMAENTGATGGFLVPVEQEERLLAVEGRISPIRERATIIPMRRRQLNIPVLDQTGTTAGQSHFYGGMVPQWTEEAAEKAQTDPTFRQISLVAHKLVLYTRASDELLADEAVGLEAFLTGNMGFTGAIRAEEAYAFLRGDGVGKPRGVVGSGAAYVHARDEQFDITVNDIAQMVSHAYGENLVWHISRSMMPQLIQLNGPAGNPSYVFMPNTLTVPATLFGYPIVWDENAAVLGSEGDVVLADWGYYLIGDRQATTVESSNHERFRYDETSWRAVHRVDGQPWLSAPLTLRDGTTQVSPFVVLGAKTT